MDVMIIFNQMLVIMLIVLVGVLCARLHLITEENSKFLSSFVVKVLNPAVIFTSVLANAEGGRQQHIGLTFVIVMCSYALIILFAFVVAPLFTRDRKEQRIYKMMMIFSNLGFIGIPVISSLFGQAYLIYVAIFLLWYNILFYVFRTIYLSETPISQMRLRDLRALINPGTVSSLITLLIFSLKIEVPYVIASAIQSLGNTVTPLALILIGVSVGAQKPFWKLFTNGKAYLIAAIHLLLFPLIGAWIMKHLGVPEYLAQLCTVMFAMPVGSMPMLFATEYGVGEEVCSKSVVLSTLVTFLTMPLVMMIYPYL